ncbi:uncharacterized protein FFM5_15278 [Fusarium fujikuroi]|nr:uncharacterized protein FFM5_15278 [Fusarium fujikuroi]
MRKNELQGMGFLGYGKPVWVLIKGQLVEARFVKAKADNSDEEAKEATA